MASLFSYKSSLLSYKSCLLLQSPPPRSQNYWIGQPNRYRTDSKSKFLIFSPENIEIQLHIRIFKWGSCAFIILLVIQFSSVAQSCLTLCNPMNHSTPGLPVHHQLQEFTQTHVHRVGDAIQPSHPLSSPSLPAPNPSQHQSLFQ